MTTPGDGEAPRPDLRFTSHEDNGVSIDRDLSGTGHLARGSHTNMSRINFSMTAKPRDYLDPELQALRPAVAAARVEPAPPPVVEAPLQSAPAASVPPVPSLLQRFAAVFRRGGA